MNRAEITYDAEKAISLYQDYTEFKRIKEFEKIPTKFLLIFSSLLVLIGFLSGIEMFWILGLISIVLIGLFILFYVIQFEAYSRKLLSSVNEKSKNADKNYVFSFDAELIKYESNEVKTEMKWSMIKYYEENGSDLYLYVNNNELFDIISIKILGDTKFHQFKEILKINVSC